VSRRNREVVLRLIELVLAGEADAALELLAEDFVEHSPFIPPGKEGFGRFAREIGARDPTPQVSIQRVVADEEFAVVHYHSVLVPGEPGSMVAEIFRLSDGLITEHWDVVQPLTTHDPQSVR
jgi:predicted SnoaL-like aldol condensation-catalyzing enzyme